MKNQKGFTLVEIIVVLVIIGVLAAFTVPTMLGFVAEAKGKAYIAEAREVYVAAQAVATEFNAVDGMTDGGSDSGKSSTGTSNQDWYGLSTSLSSTKIARRMTYTEETPYVGAMNEDRVRASYRMLAYLDEDIEISDVDLIADQSKRPDEGEAAWIITVGAGGSSLDGTGKVTAVTYYKDGYQVVISDESTQVSKW
ncbi:prepilin-type N-terminal cleavage/methylation domain-containing protein [Eubacteriaceae bacterium ES2]|nr:prepilin-type N-terminal cleavage/methylation domain-containing protein [Eubacteriaceae bacterium ES2]